MCFKMVKIIQTYAKRVTTPIGIPSGGVIYPLPPQHSRKLARMYGPDYFQIHFFLPSSCKQKMTSKYTNQHVSVDPVMVYNIYKFVEIIWSLQQEMWIKDTNSQHGLQLQYSMPSTFTIFGLSVNKYGGPGFLTIEAFFTSYLQQLHRF